MSTQEQNTNARFDCVLQQRVIYLFIIWNTWCIQFCTTSCDFVKRWKKLNKLVFGAGYQEANFWTSMILHDLSCLKVHVHIDYCSVIRLWTQQLDADVWRVFFFIGNIWLSKDDQSSSDVLLNHISQLKQEKKALWWML